MRFTHVLLGCTLILMTVAACGPIPDTPPAPTPTPTSVPLETLRLFWVNSYTADDLWSQLVYLGISGALTQSGYSVGANTLEVQAYHMNVRQLSLTADLTEEANAAIAAIKAYAPDIVVFSGNEATREVIQRYRAPDLPFVFCGLVGSPEQYNLTQPNVTGVLEEPNPVQTIAMAYAFVENAERFMILGDASTSGSVSTETAYREIAQSAYGTSAPLFRMIESWPLWQRVVLEDAANVDFILLTSYQGVADAQGRPMDGEVLMAWMLENSPVPIFALSNQAVLDGAVGGLVTYGYEEGVSAGQLILRIVQGAHPSAIKAQGPSRNLLAVNLAAAYHWNLRIPITFPLAARVYNTLPAAQGGQ